MSIWSTLHGANTSLNEDPVNGNCLSMRVVEISSILLGWVDGQVEHEVLDMSDIIIAWRTNA